MIQIKPYIQVKSNCECGGDMEFSELLWQGLHVCEKSVCTSCKQTRIASLPVNQSVLEQYTYYPESRKLTGTDGNPAKANWFSSKLIAISDPNVDLVNIEIEIISDRPNI